MLPPRNVTSLRVFCRIFNRTCTADNGYLCARPGLFCVIYLPATSRRSDSAKIQQESIYEAFILESYGFWQVIILVAKL